MTLNERAHYGTDELLPAVAEGSEEAFTSLFRLYKNRIYSVALKLTESTFLAEEIVQDVFLKVWLRREKLVHIRNFEDYLFIMARNHVFTAMQSLSRQQLLEANWQGAMPFCSNNSEEELNRKELEALWQEALQRLSPQQQQIYLLSQEKELTRDDIAQLLRISPETVKTHLSRAVKSMRAFITARLETTILCIFPFILK